MLTRGIQSLNSFSRMMYFKNKYRKNLQLSTKKQLIKYNTNIKIAKGATMSLHGIRTNDNVNLVSVSGSLTIGNGVSFNRNCIVICRKKITIGDNCIFGPNVCIYDHDHLFSKTGIENNQYKSSEIIIEPGCWIGAGVIILRGTHIGKNSVIGAGVVLKGKVPSNSLVTPDVKNKIIPIR